MIRQQLLWPPELTAPKNDSSSNDVESHQVDLIRVLMQKQPDVDSDVLEKLPPGCRLSYQRVIPPGQFAKGGVTVLCFDPSDFPNGSQATQQHLGDQLVQASTASIKAIATDPHRIVLVCTSSGDTSPCTFSLKAEFHELVGGWFMELGCPPGSALHTCEHSSGQSISGDAGLNMLQAEHVSAAKRPDSEGEQHPPSRPPDAAALNLLSLASAATASATPSEPASCADSCNDDERERADATASPISTKSQLDDGEEEAVAAMLSMETGAVESSSSCSEDNSEGGKKVSEGELKPAAVPQRPAAPDSSDHDHEDNLSQNNRKRDQDAVSDVPAAAMPYARAVPTQPLVPEAVDASAPPKKRRRRRRPEEETSSMFLKNTSDGDYDVEAARLRIAQAMDGSLSPATRDPVSWRPSHVLMVDPQKRREEELGSDEPNDSDDEDEMTDDEVAGNTSSDLGRSFWMQRFRDLKQYKQEHGHCLVPQQYEANPALGNWVKNQRAQYKLYMQRGGTGKQKPQASSHHDAGKTKRSCGLTPERIQRLEKIGFQWRVSKNRPIQNKKASEKPRRPSKNVGSGPPDHADVISFAMNDSDEVWLAFFHQLEAYYQQHAPLCPDILRQVIAQPNGNCRHPIHLRRWMLEQRKQYKLLLQEGKSFSSTLSAERICMLQERLAFDSWVTSGTLGGDSQDDMANQLLAHSTLRNNEDEEGEWMVMYKQLQDYHTKHGTSLVVPETANEEVLAQWTMLQRERYESAASQISPRATPESASDTDRSRIELLNRLQFEWSAEEMEWMTSFVALGRHVQRNGLGSLPSDQKLLLWVMQQRKQGSSVRRKELVELLGFPNLAGKEEQAVSAYARAQPMPLVASQYGWSSDSAYPAHAFVSDKQHL